MNAVSVMLLMATSSVTGSSVGARENASATGMAFPGLYVSWYEISAACVVAAWELSLVASRGSQLAVYGQSPQ